MGLMGIPTADEMASMMGYVTDEDRGKWEAKKARSDAEMQRRGQMGQSVTGPVLGMAEKTVNAQMQGEMIAIREREKADRQIKKKTVKTVTSFEETEHIDKDDFEMGG